MGIDGTPNTNDTLKITCFKFNKNSTDSHIRALFQHKLSLFYNFTDCDNNQYIFAGKTDAVHPNSPLLFEWDSLELCVKTAKIGVHGYYIIFLFLCLLYMCF